MPSETWPPNVTLLAPVAPAMVMPEAVPPFDEIEPKWLKLPPMRPVIATAVPPVLAIELSASKVTAALPPDTAREFTPVMSTLVPVTVPALPDRERPVPLPLFTETSVRMTEPDVLASEIPAVEVTPLRVTPAMPEPEMAFPAALPTVMLRTALPFASDRVATPPDELVSVAAPRPSDR